MVILDIGIVGCGVAGQAAAILLADAGHRVTIFERFVEPRPIGAGLLLQPTGLAVLHELGLADEVLARGARVVGLESRTHRGRSVLDLRYADLHPKAFGLGIRRSDLFDLLHGRLLSSRAKLITGAEIVDVDKETHVVEENGTRHGPFDLVIAADGTNSALRGRLMPNARAPLYPWGCFWTTVPDVAGIGSTGLLRQRVRGTTIMMGLLPVGQGQVTLFWSLPLKALARNRPIDLGAWRKVATEVWPAAAPIVERAAEAEITRASYRHVNLPRCNAGPVLFIGDAAHGTSPQLGQGANLGLVDAHTLAAALAETPDLLSAFLLFERRRDSTVRYYRQASHLLTPFFQSRLAPLGWLRDAFMGWACHVPGVRPLMGTTLAGLRTGWLTSATLDDEGRYPLALPSVGATGRTPAR